MHFLSRLPSLPLTREGWCIIGGVLLWLAAFALADRLMRRSGSHPAQSLSKGPVALRSGAAASVGPLVGFEGQQPRRVSGSHEDQVGT